MRPLTPLMMALAGTLVLASAPAARAADAPPAPETAQAPTSATTILSRQFDFVSQVNGRAYRVQVAQPFAPPPAGGYPVLYVLDGDAYFGSFAAAARLRNALGHEIGPAVIVGIGYPTDALPAVIAGRSLDLTPSPASTAQKARDRATFGAELAYGDADAFLRVVQTEVKPRIAAALPVDPQRDVLFGHSLGGLFGLHVLLTQPQDFHTYLLLSPSIWWDDQSVLKDEAGFRARLQALPTGPRVFVGVGSLEQSAPVGADAELAAGLIAETRMIDRAADLAARLKALPAPAGYQIGYRVFEGQTHNSVPWAALNPLLDFALADRAQP